MSVAEPLTLGFGVFNTSDNEVNSGLAIDDVRGVSAAPLEAPEIDPNQAATPLTLIAIAFLLISDRRPGRATLTA